MAELSILSKKRFLSQHNHINQKLFLGNWRQPQITGCYLYLFLLFQQQIVFF